MWCTFSWLHEPGAYKEMFLYLYGWREWEPCVWSANIGLEAASEKNILHFWTPNSVQLNKYLLSTHIKNFKARTEHTKRNKVCSLPLRKVESFGMHANMQTDYFHTRLGTGNENESKNSGHTDWSAMSWAVGSCEKDAPLCLVNSQKRIHYSFISFSGKMFQF